MRILTDLQDPHPMLDAFRRHKVETVDLSSIIRDASPGPDKLTVAQQIEQIQTSRINLNIGAICDDREVSWGLPDRCFGIPACGGFLVCDYRRHAFETFPADAWVDYTDLGDCIQKIRYYLDHFEEARQKAEILHKTVLRFHTYQHRVESILNLVEAWRSGRR